MNYKFTQDAIDKYNRIVSFINEHDMFWLMDLRRHMGLKTADPYEQDQWILTKALSKLKLKEVIQCCKVSGSEKQFITTRVATIQDILPNYKE